VASSTTRLSASRSPVSDTGPGNAERSGRRALRDFTLRDLVSYAAKHNAANGEDNLDDLNESDVVVLRARQVPDFFPEGALSDPLAAHNKYLVISASKLMPQ